MTGEGARVGLDASAWLPTDCSEFRSRVFRVQLKRFVC